MKRFRKVLLGAALIALAGCATGPRIRGHLSAQQVEEFMARGVLAEVFAGHRRIVVTMDNGDMYVARLPEMEKIEAYLRYRQSIGKPVIQEME